MIPRVFVCEMTNTAPRKTNMAKPRNTIETEYPLDLRLEIAQWLLDAVSYSDIRARLAARGVEHLPHNSSLKAYQDNAEFRKYREELINWKHRAEEKRIIASALEAGGGAGALADIAMFEAVDALRDLISGGILTSGKDVATVATAISNLKRTLLKGASEDRKAEIEELEKEHDAQMAEAAADQAEKHAECARLRELLAAAGIDPDAERQDDHAGLSDAALREIEERAKLL